MAVPSPSSRVDVGKETGESGQQGNDDEQGPSSQRAKDAYGRTVSAAVPIRRRRGRAQERQSRSSRKTSSIGRSLERSASRRRVIRRASSSLAAARADVRRMRQRRRIVVDPLATTEEAAEAKQLTKWSRELESGRKGEPGSSIPWK